MYTAENWKPDSKYWSYFDDSEEISVSKHYRMREENIYKILNSDWFLKNSQGNNITQGFLTTGY